MSDLNEDYAKGLWVPNYYGNRFELVRNKNGLYERTKQRWKILEEAQAECDRRNKNALVGS